MGAVQILYMDQGLEMEGLAGVTMVLTLLALLLGALWFFLPFAVFGIKPKIDAAITEARHANAQLKALLEEQAATRKAFEEMNATLLRGLRPAPPRAPAAPPPPPVPRA